MVLQVDHGHARVRPLEAVLVHVRLDEAALDDPVQLALERHGVPRELIQHGAPARHHVVHPGLVLALAVVAVGQLEELPLHVHGGDVPPVLEPQRLAARQVPRDPAVGEDGALEGEVAVDEIVLDHAEDDGHGPHLQIGGHLAHVGVANDHVEAPVLLGVGVGLVARVDDRPAVHRLEADLGLEEVRALRNLIVAVLDVVLGADLACPRVDLPRREKWHEVLDDAGEGHLAIHQIVLVGAVGVALAVGVVLVDQDPLLRRRHGFGAGARQVQNALARLVPDHAVPGIGRLGRRVLGVGVVHVEARPVGEDQVDQPRLLLRRDLLVLHVLEAPGVAQGALRLVVPADARRPIRLIGVDQEERGEDRIEVGLVLDRDAVLGLDAHYFRNRHDVPGTSLPPKEVRHTRRERGVRSPPPPSFTGTGRC